MNDKRLVEIRIISLFRQLYKTFVHFSLAMLGNYQESLNDAKAAVELQPTYMEAIERGKVF